MSKGKGRRSARQKGEERKRRRRRAYRRDATLFLRLRTNAVMRAQGHPGWVTPEPELSWYHSTDWPDY